MGEGLNLVSGHGAERGEVGGRRGIQSLEKRMAQRSILEGNNENEKYA